jgi:HD superfamily phosphohydrolase
MHIRDPIHGSIDITPAERAVIDSRFYQRLRHIKQLGFADLAFPGATHTRYAHGIGAMSVASRVFDALYRQLSVPAADQERLRQTLRLAVLLHDLGHPPFSHATERYLPLRRELSLPAWTGGSAGEEQASHEDMTLLLLLASELSAIIRDSFRDLGIKPEHVASLLCGREPDPSSPFVVGSVDHAPLLRQLVSSELDADRMDYLLRDSFYTGVHYGRYDMDWIVQNVEPVVREGRVLLGLDRRAVMAFEDFLLSRHHMFLSVYYHSASINFERMLANYFATSSGEYRLPSDPEQYVRADDVELLGALRRSSNPWARRVVERHGYSLLVELTPSEREVDLGPLRAALKGEGIDYFEAESLGVLSKYFASPEDRPPILVHTALGDWTPIEEHTALFRRYRDAARIVRIYVAPEQRVRARQLAGPLARTEAGSPASR